MMPPNKPCVTAGWGRTSNCRRSILVGCERTTRDGGFLPRDFMGLSERKPDQERVAQTTNSEQQEREEERRKLRRLQIMMNMVMSVISQDQGLTVEEASEM